MFEVGDKVQLQKHMGGENLTEGSIYTVHYVVESLQKIKVVNDIGEAIMVPSWMFQLVSEHPIEKVFVDNPIGNIDREGLCIDEKSGSVTKFKQSSMNQEAYLVMFRELTETMNETTKKKNSDYTGGDNSDPFKNFRSSEAFGVSTEKGFMTRMSDKWMRLCGLVGGHKPLVKESIEDTLLDLATYCLLLICYLRSK